MKKTKKPTFVRRIAKSDLLVVLSPTPNRDGAAPLAYNDGHGLIRTYKQGGTDPRLKALRLPTLGDQFKVVDLLRAGRRCITTVRVLKAICHFKDKDFAEPLAFKPRAKPTRKALTVTQIMANAG
jgi:hypothetical protein